MRFRMQFLAVCVLIVFASLVCEAKVSEAQARQSAETAARLALGANAPKLLHVRRLEEFEELLFDSQLHIRGRIGYPAYLYAVTTTGAFIISPDEDVYVTSNSYDPKRIVAVSVESGKTFTLSGFPDAETGFADLIREMGVQIRDNHDAEMLARLYYSLVRDPENSNYLENALTLKHRVEDYYAGQGAGTNADLATRLWWNGFRALKRKHELGVQAAAADGSFLVTVAFLGYSSHVPIVNQLVLHISPLGEIKAETDRRIYPSTKITQP
jgi:hypothetical protein